MTTDRKFKTGERKQYLRRKLFKQQDGRCYSCRKPMTLYTPGSLKAHNTMPDDAACLTRRKLPPVGQPEFTDPRDRLMCMACRKCVAARDHARTLQIPIEDRRLAAGRHPVSCPPDGTLPDLLKPWESIG